MSITRQVTLENEQGVTIVSFGRRPFSITEEVIPEISEPVLKSAAGESPRVLLDLSAVDFFSSSFIELMFRAWNRIKNKPGGQFALCCLHPYCKEVLEITNLTMVWKVYDSREEAMQALQSGTATWTAPDTWDPPQ